MLDEIIKALKEKKGTLPLSGDSSDESPFQQFAAAVFEYGASASLLVAEDSGILYANQRLRGLIDYSLDEIIGRRWPHLVAGEQRTAADRFHSLLFSNDVSLPDGIELRLNTRRGEAIYALASAVAFPGWSAGLICFTDITARKIAEDKLKKLAYHDSLTRLPNKTLFLDRLDHVITLAGKDPDYSFAFLLIDLDRFKPINDSFGHDVGDDFLRLISRRIQENIRPADTLCRLESDCFGILVEGPGAHDEALQLADELQQLIQIPVTIDGHEIATSAGIGIVLSNGDYTNPEHVLRDAETAMLNTKKSGRGHFQIFNRHMLDEVKRMAEMDKNMRIALENNEFFLQYQPYVDIKEKRIVGLEALVRWRHPGYGLLSPAEFIPAAEENELIVPIGKSILQQAVRDGMDFIRAAGSPDVFHININISALQLIRGNLPAHVRTVLTDTGMAASRIKLEITETALMRQAYSAIPTMEQLRSMGVNIAVDDFGTGYSSLSYLHYLPVDTLKIDKSFINDLTPGDSHGKVSKENRIVRTILHLAEELDLHTIAEGIETREQLKAIQEIGITLVQGFLFSRPKDKEEIIDLLNNGLDFSFI